MPRRKSLDEPQSSPPLDVPRVARRWLVQVMALVLVIGLALGGLFWIARQAREQLHYDDRCS